MSNESVLEYIKEHLTDIEKEQDEATDPDDHTYFEGAIDVMEHLLTKFGVEY